MKNKLTLTLKALVAGALALALTPSAEAVPTLRLSDGINTVTIADGAILGVNGAIATDSNPLTGIVTFLSFNVGEFTVNVTTGISKPLDGTAAEPSMDLNSVNVSGGTGTLTMWFSDDFFGPTSNHAFASIGGTINTAEGSKIEYSTYASLGNSLFDEQILLTNQTFGGGSFSGDQMGALFPGTTPYSLTQKIVLTHTADGISSFDAVLTSVPDGGSTVALLGCSFLGLSYVRSRFALSKA